MFKFRISKKFEDIEPHEIILDSLARRKEEEIGITGKKLEVPILRIIIQIFSFSCILVLLLLFGKTFQLQVLEGKELSLKADENKFIITKLQAERGVIYDRDMEQLVYNRSSFDLVFYKSYIPEDENEFNGLLKEASGIANKTVEELKAEIGEASGKEVVLAEDLDHQSLILAETKIKDLDGFEIRNNSVREYLDGEIFSHVLGYTGRITQEEYAKSEEYYSITDYIGRSGLEKYYEEDLRKDPGELVTERDALGNVLSQSVASEPQSGNSLVLSLDAGLQKKMVSGIQSVLERIGSKKAVGIAMDPNTGEILALASFPGYDNNLFQKGGDAGDLQAVLTDKDEPLFNRAISGRYLTGSTIKPFLASGVLEEGIITASKKIYCDGEIYVQNPYDPTKGQSFTDMHTHGWVDIRKAIAESCNVFFYTVGGGFEDQKGLGPTKIKEYLELFGWNEKTGIDLPGEAAGFLPDKEWKKKIWKQDWWDGDTYNLSIGQGYLLITPLEVINAYSAIANGGTLYEPHIVRTVLGSDGEEIVGEIEPEIIRKDFISQETLEIVREGMRQAVTGENSPQATALDLNALSVSAAAKTGTAETSKGGNYHSWITAFAPYDNPEIIMTIMIEDVEGIQRTVTPLAYEILNWYFSEGN
ncbi:MAG: penicillin-binding protein 2 [Candidatus Paceibacterota bacterium]|jgi:penicillin-binding protein 2